VKWRCYVSCADGKKRAVVSSPLVNGILAYTSSAMVEKSEQTQVWIAVVGVAPRDGCELLSVNKGAYINFLTLASSEAEYRAKVAGALGYYCLELLEFEDVRPFSRSDGSSEEIVLIAEELERDNNPQHVRFSTFHTFPRVM
jgi:hypothetical protein